MVLVQDREQVLEQLAAAALNQENARKRRDGSGEEVTHRRAGSSQLEEGRDGGREAGEEGICDCLISL